MLRSQEDLEVMYPNEEKTEIPPVLFFTGPLLLPRLLFILKPSSNTCSGPMRAGSRDLTGVVILKEKGSDEYTPLFVKCAMLR